MAFVFALTGVAALALQVVWQREISMNSGVDLSSSTTVVAGFLAGLGIGSLLGGRLADRVGPERSLLLFALANVGVAVFAWFSTALFYDLYREVAPSLSSRPSLFAFNFALLLVPTTLQGLSLPLVARIVSKRTGDAGPLVGRLYGINTLGAAFGAIFAGWYLMGEHGFIATTRVAGTLNGVAALLVVGIWWHRRLRPSAPEAADAPPVAAASPVPWRWYAIYGVSGAVALSFQQVFFRLIDAIVRSNSYSFSLVLAVYLGVWGLGAALGSLAVRRATSLQQWFLGLQFGSAFVAASAFVLLTRGLPHLGLGPTFERWFNSDGFASGFADGRWGDTFLFALGAPALLMGVPILLLGASYPFVQAIVADDPALVGRRTGGLSAANIVGNVGGTLLTGFVLIDLLGTAGTFRLLCALMVPVGIWAVCISPARPARRSAAGLLVVALVGLVAAMPSNDQLWRFLVGARDGEQIAVHEDHSCGSVLEIYGEGAATLVINGATQNGFPYDDFHVLIGLMPLLTQPDPERGLAIGFGIGSTTYAMLADPRLDRARTVELCGGNYEVAKGLAAAGTREFREIFGDERSDLVVGDGRRELLVGDGGYDAIVVDTLRPTSANSGSHFSNGLFELAADRLSDGGVFAEWIPGPRVANAAATVFPYLVMGTVEGYNSSRFMLGSRTPIEDDPDVLLERFDAMTVGRFSEDQRTRLREFIATWEPECLTNGTVATDVDSNDINTDLRPLDEYSLNNRAIPDDRMVTTC